MSLIVELLLGAAGTVVTGAVPVLGQMAYQALLRWRLNSALGRAAGQAFAAISMIPGARDRLEDVVQGAVSAAADYVADAMPDTLRALRVDRDRLEAMVQGEVGRLLAGLGPLAPVPTPKAG